ncbi:DNA/RNA-binding protein KIN17-like, partial [Trifolium medium]|nr:DNA/RNA-binding protein KIN17-like [Trifolium medium]
SLARPVTKEKHEETSRVVFDEVDDEKFDGKSNLKRKESGGGKSILEEMIREEERKKEKINRKDYWLHEGIVVKVMSKALEEKGYYKQKGVVRKVIGKYIGEIEMLESKHVLRVDQEELETVIPQIEKGAYDGRVLKAVEYEDICKVA